MTGRPIVGNLRAWHAGCPATGRTTPMTPEPEDEGEQGE